MPCWRRMANSLKDRVEFVGLWSTAFPLGLEGWLGREGSEEEAGQG